MEMYDRLYDFPPIKTGWTSRFMLEPRRRLSCPMSGTIGEPANHVLGSRSKNQGWSTGNK